MFVTYDGFLKKRGIKITVKKFGTAIKDLKKRKKYLVENTSNISTNRGVDVASI